MGLLNFMQDPKRAGLLMAAARMAEMSGPSRTPVGIGQILGGGLGAFMQTNQAMKQQQMQDAEQEQMQQYRGMQMQGMEQQQEAAKAALQRAQALQQHMAKLRGGGGSMPAASMGGEVFAGAAQRAGLSGDNGTLNQIVNGVNQGLSPDDAAARVAGGTQAQQPQESPYQRHMSMADHLRAGGYEAEANEYEDRALKFAPKVKNWQEVRVGDSVQFAPFFEDGTTGKPVPMEIARKLEFRDGGGTNDAFDPYTGQRKVSQQKTQSPDSIASVAVQVRGQNMVDARHREEIAAGGKPPPGYRWTPQGTLSAIPGGPGDKLPEAQQKQVVGVNNLSNAIAEYRDQLKGFGAIDFAKPDARAVMGTKYNNMMLLAKEAYNLGVLNGPDFEILQSVITDPRSARGVFTSKDALDKQASELDRIMQKVAQVSGAARQPQQTSQIVDFGSLK